MDKTTARDIMSTELILLREGDTIEEALKQLVNNKITGLPVVNAKNEMVGVLSEYDLIRQISSKPLTAELFHEPAEFSRNAFSLPTETTLREIVQHFLDSKYRRIPIVDNRKKLVGIVTRRDLMRVYFYRAKLT